MKRCPQCKIEYFDEILEFCLEDGAKLVQFSGSPTATKSNKPNPATAETVNLPFSNVPETVDFKNAPVVVPDNLTKLPEAVASQSYRALEVAPIVIALAHNWWQWVYLNNFPYYSFTAYVASANFLMWLLLLAAGAAVGFLALKLCQNKGFAYASLVMMAINLILFLVPNR